nr:hypothetical protein B0A51_03285 [Rachicladosporium sp. CCFEE 5018]
MWLLNARTFELKYYHSVAQAPHYAILSHTWEDEEVIFQDVRDLESARTKQGWLKIQYTCEQALRDDLAYCWVDTCCINKESSAELSEAINSMFNYYGGATICYVFLADVTQSLRLTDLMDLDPGLRDIMDTSRRGRRSGPEVAWNSSVTEQFKRFANARWWTRCFTLQELIAPPDLQFYNQEWLLIARKHDIGMLISARTGVDISVLRRTASPLDMTIAKRLSWAASRQATREEDVAYSLLGLLDINLPLLYGEGSRAFLRLQEELLRTKSDLSILAWKLSVPRAVAHGLFPFTQPALFAKSPGDFEECGSVEASSMEEQIHRLVLTSTVMEVDLPVISAGLRTKKPETDSKHQLADLGCTVHGSSASKRR